MTGPDKRTPGSSMGRVAAAIVALGALPAPLLTGPLVRLARGSDAPSELPDVWTQATDPLMLAVYPFYAVVLFAVLATVAYGVRRSSYAGAARDWATLRSLGMERRAVVRDQARRGAALGATASGIMVGLGALAAILAPTWGSWGNGRGLTFDPWTLAVDALAVSMGAAATSGVFALVAHHATAVAGPRRPATASADAPPDENPFAEPRAHLRAWAVRLVLAIGAASAGYQVWRRLHPDRIDPATGYFVWPESPSRALDSTTRAIVVLEVFVALAAVATWAGLSLTSATGRWWSRRGPTPFAIAGDGLAGRSTERTIAAATMAVVLGLTGYWAAGASLESATAASARGLFADYTVTPMIEQLPEYYPGGYSPATVPSEITDALAADPRLIVVPLGLLYADPLAFDQEGSLVDAESTTAEVYWLQDSYAVFDPAAAGGARRDVWLALGLGPGTIPHGSLFGPGQEGGGVGAAWLTVDGERHHTFRVASPSPTSAMDRDWATKRFGAPPVNALMIYLASPGDLDGQQRYDAVAAIVGELLPDPPPFWNLNTSDGLVQWGRDPYSPPVAGTVLALLGVAIGVALTGALAAASARGRRGELATLAALGARPWTLRIAPAIEAGATALVAAVAGVTVGAGAAIVRAHPALLEPGGPVELTSTARILWWNAAHLSWGYLLAMALVACAAAAVVGLLYGVSGERRSPVEELREALKEGSL